MALPFEIQIGRVSRFLSKWASTKGSSPRLAMGSEVVPVLPFWSGVENRFLDSWAKYGASFFVAAAAANESGFQMRDPAGSNVIAVFEKIVIIAQQQVNLYNGPQITDLATAIPYGGPPGGPRFDARGSQRPTIVASSQNTTVSIPGLANGFDVVPSQTIRQDIILTDNQEIPLLPGEAIRLVGQTVNTSFTVVFYWRERALEESELQ